MKKPQLVAPAGDWEKLKTAFFYGADAVYASTADFSLRSREIKFDLKTLQKAIDYTHKLNKGIYITLNTFPHAQEIKSWQKYAQKIIRLQPDALIVADIGLIKYLQSITDIPIHLSTQANTVNHLTANFWKKQGIKRIVLARELNIRDIKLISQKTKLYLEVFVHGAMCMSYSGRCQISNYLVGRDPNKGQCIQACRFKYQLYGVKEETRQEEIFPIYEDDLGTYLFNSRDLCMIEYIPQLIKAGISAFKIEGRTKSAYYVGSVTKLYRQAIDEYWQSHQKYKDNLPYYQKEMQKINNRGYTTGFYFSKPNQHTNNYLSSKETSAYNYIARVVSYNPKRKIAFLEVKNYLPAASILEFLLPNEIIKYKLTQIIYKNKTVSAAHANYLINISIDKNLPAGCLVRTKYLEPI